MKISEIRVSKRITINKGNYESLQIETSVVVDLNEVDNLDDVRNFANLHVNQTIKEEAAKAGEKNLTRFGL